MSTLPEYAELKAKFQVYDGVGPTDMIAVVSPAADENAFTGIVPQEGILQCLISQTVDVKSGQSATVVITATTRNDVLILPLSVIAGRQGTGLVYCNYSEWRKSGNKSDIGCDRRSQYRNTVRLRGGRCSFCYSAKP